MASDVFLKIGDIKGESLDDRHKDEIQVLSFSWGMTGSGQTPVGAGASAGKATFHPLSFVHKIDKASPALMRACATGAHLPEATMTHRKADSGQEHLIVTMSGVTVSGVSYGGNAVGDDTESVSLQFEKVVVAYRAQKPDGTLDAAVSFKYDIKGQREG